MFTLPYKNLAFNSFQDNQEIASLSDRHDTADGQTSGQTSSDGQDTVMERIFTISTGWPDFVHSISASIYHTLIFQIWNMPIGTNGTKIDSDQSVQLFQATLLIFGISCWKKMENSPRRYFVYFEDPSSWDKKMRWAKTGSLVEAIWYPLAKSA